MESTAGPGREAPAPAGDSGVSVTRGHVHLLYAYDVGQAIDLARCRTRLAQPTRPAVFGTGPSQFDPAPLRVSLGAAGVPRPEGGTAPAACEAVLYDFGAISLAYAVPFAGSLAGLRALAEAAEAGVLEADARARAAKLVEAAGDAVRRPFLAPVVEDYAIFEIEGHEPPVPPGELLRTHALALARLLRVEKGELSDDEVGDALASRLSFERDDLVLVDWKAALVFGEGAEDIREVLEFANVRLLEVRFLDSQLDGVLDRCYETLARVRGGFPALSSRAGMHRIGRMQVDAALFHESVRNALKLLSDQFLARVYRLVAARFHLGEWDSSVQRKLETLESIYQKSFDRAAARRMEILEWLIILLIAVGLILPFLLPYLE